VPERISANGFTIRGIRRSPDGERPSLGYLRVVRTETVIFLFGLIIGVLLWYGVRKVLLADHANRSPTDPKPQPKEKT
jgi:hypothetical protein